MNNKKDHTNWVDGDIFRWEYTDQYIKSHQDSVRSGTLYWCCSKIGVVENGILKDTFWASSSTGACFNKDDIGNIIEIEFLANYNDIEETRYPQFYEEKDVVDIRHANMMRGGLYIRKGSKRSKNKMKRLIEIKIGEAKSKIESCNRDIKWLNQKLSEIETADIENFYV